MVLNVIKDSFGLLPEMLHCFAHQDILYYLTPYKSIRFQ